MEHDVDFCAWLRGDEQMTVKEVLSHATKIGVEQLRKEYCNNFLKSKKDILNQHKKQQLNQEEKVQMEQLKLENKQLKQQIQLFQKEHLVFQEQETKINYSESRVQELTGLIKQRKEKINSIFKRLLPDKEKENLKCSWRNSAKPRATFKLHENNHLQIQNKTIELNNYLMKTQQLAKEMIDLKDFKRNDFKKALKLVLEKSDDELEEIIDEELKEALGKIKELKDKSQVKDNKCQELEEKKTQLEKELNKLKNAIIVNNQLEEDDLEDILEVQASSDLKQLERVKKKIKKIISEKEINDLCQKQTEIAQLEIKLQENIAQKTQQLTQIINEITIQGVNIENYGSANIGSVSIQDHVQNNNQPQTNSSSLKINIMESQMQVRQWEKLAQETREFNQQFQNQQQAQIQQTDLPNLQNK